MTRAARCKLQKAISDAAKTDYDKSKTTKKHSQKCNININNNHNFV
jgi:hypothetical protein